ncbi:hypothetical protein [uncultured Brachyspira sp.]|uniref:hypothetical protein n=1 Tax=uncultured Brachyspira sp. TaxID=221953 RepID=UPI00260EC6FF|nr:hypothetical protein [uncultured Brachyspira sp.]
MSLQKLNSNDEAVAIKMSAEYSDLNKYIYMVFFIDKYNNCLIDFTFVISDDYKLLNFLNAYTDLLELYKHIKIYNRLNNNNSEYLKKFNEVIMNIMSEEKNINNIIIYQSNNNNISIIDIFSSSMSRFMDFHIGVFDVSSKIIDTNSVRLAIENVNKEIEEGSSMHIANNNNSAEQNTDNNEPETPSYKLIEASFIVDPMGGKSINDIEPGDKVIVSINSNTVEENIIYLELKGKKDKNSKYLVPAEVLEKTAEEKSIKILLKLIDGYCCLIEEIEPIKLKLFSPNKDIKDIKDANNEENILENKDNTFLEKIFSKFNMFKLIMFGLGTIIILVFLAILYVFYFQI